MATYTQKGITVDAFQWLGGSLGNYSLPAWAMALALQTPGDGTLNLPTPRGTVRVNNTDYAVRYASGHIDVMSAATFTASFS